MLIYGDHKDAVAPEDALAQVQAELQRLKGLPPGIGRHSALVGVFIESGRLLQGVVDADFVRSGADRSTFEIEALGRLLRDLAGAVIQSWERPSEPPHELTTVPRLQGLPALIEMKVPEGYAFYALYPEAFAEAARKLKLAAPPCVIGIRSIGTSLGAIVAAALRAPPPVSVRPIGDPFNRRVAISEELAAELLSAERHFVIVDEGPGLSGSSFGAVADWLEGRGVPRDRIAFLCSHGNPPGPKALQRHRVRWAQVQRVVADFGRGLPELVRRWAEKLVGPIEHAPVEISGGWWRLLQDPAESHSPAVNPMWERRKFLLRSKEATYLARFVGLGAEGTFKLAIARQLHSSGLVPRPFGLVHGFLVEQWHEDAMPLGPGAKPLDLLGEYIGTRASLPVPRPGASIAELFAMMRRNLGLALGPEVEQRLDLRRSHLAALQRKMVLACTDGRLDRHEWLRLSNGSSIKADATDHHAAHDPIGCQDLAWDVAGAAVEFGLDEGETRALARGTASVAGRPIDPELLGFLTLAYLGFRIGQSVMSARMTSGEESQRWDARSNGYLATLSATLQRSTAPRLAASLGSSTMRNEPAREQS